MENPKIRFKGFTKDWEQRKVSEITKFHKQGFYTTEEYDNSKKYYLLRGTDLTENKLVLKDTPKIDATEKDYDAFKTEIGDFLIVRSGTVGTYGIVDVDIPAIFGSYLIDFRFDMEQVTNEFFGYFYQSSLFKSQLNKIIQASANTNINAENIKSTVISLPSLNEQRRISEYLGNLDNLITLHQRKCEQTKKLKKYMLQKMFPQNGAKVPEIRFDGFTYDWEQRKFGSLLEETRNKTIFEDEDTLLSCAIDGMYLNSELFSHFRGSSNIGYLKVKKNDLILSAQNLHLGNCNVNLRFEHGIISPAYKVYELVGCNPLFMQAWVKKDSTKDFFLKSSTEGASVCRKNIVWEELYKQELPVPSIEEQTKVGEYFYSLDHLITLHQRKCDELKKMKKYMLQNMFI